MSSPSTIFFVSILAILKCVQRPSEIVKLKPPAAQFDPENGARHGETARNVHASPPFRSISTLPHTDSRWFPWASRFSEAFLLGDVGDLQLQIPEPVFEPGLRGLRLVSILKTSHSGAERIRDTVRISGAAWERTQSLSAIAQRP